MMFNDENEEMEQYLSDLEKKPVPVQERIEYLLKEGFIDCRYDAESKTYGVFADPIEYKVKHMKNLDNSVFITSAKTGGAFFITFDLVKKFSVNKKLIADL